jgi:hypothetical protein
MQSSTLRVNFRRVATIGRAIQRHPRRRFASTSLATMAMEHRRDGSTFSASLLYRRGRLFRLPSYIVGDVGYVGRVRNEFRVHHDQRRYGHLWNDLARRPNPTMIIHLNQPHPCAVPDHGRWRVDTDSVCWRKQLLFQKAKPREVTVEPAQVQPEPVPALPQSDEAQLLSAIDRGLGDEVEALLHKIGADKAAQIWESITGRSCGCDNRKAWLNRHWPGGWRELFRLSKGE